MLDLNYHALLKQAQIALESGDVVKAERICEELHAKRKDDPGLLALMAHVAITLQQDQKAVQLFEKCISRQPKAIEFQLDLAKLYSRMGQYSKAVRQYEKARKLNANHPSLIAGLADAYEHAGQLDDARAALEPLISTGADTAAMAMVWARLCMDAKKPDEAVAALSRHVNAPAHPSSFFYVLGQAFEKSGQIENAFKAYGFANSRTGLKFDLNLAIAECENVIKTIRRPLLSRLPRPAHDTRRPIFIAGRPRSGTTLIEKILDAHPDVAGVGELPHLPRVFENLGFEIGSMHPYPKAVGDLDQDDVNRLSRDYLDHVRRLAPTAARTVDKNLANYQFLGPMQALFPQASVIHIRREAIDNCWAIFVADMSYAWCADLRTLGITHALYERYMTHWHQELDLPILDVDYEALVDDQEGWTRKILEGCGLPWDDRCLRYYEDAAKPKDAVSAPTLSYAQVRQPIYKTAVGRAAKFEKFLGPLREGLEEGRRIVDQFER